MSDASCPWCLATLDDLESAGLLCPRCERPLRHPGGSLVSPGEAWLEVADPRAREGLRRLLRQGSLVALGLLVGLQFLPFVGLVATPLLLLGHAVALRFLVTRHYRSRLSSSRRLLSRWLRRLAILVVGGAGYGAAATPLVGPVIGWGTFVALSVGVSAYTRWSAQQEVAGAPLSLPELVVMSLFGVALLALIVGGLALALGAGWVVAILSGSGGS